MRRVLSFLVAILCSEVAFAHHGGGSFDLSKNIQQKPDLTALKGSPIQ